MIDQLSAQIEANAPGTKRQLAWSAHAVDRSRTVLVNRLPDAVSHSMILDQALEEFLQRLGQGEQVDIESFCQNYPAVQDSLPELLRAQLLFLEHPELLPSAWPEPGTSFLGFRLECELGRGAFARVFLATEPALGNRRVVVKISQQGAHEAKTIGPLAHPNVVPVYSVRYDPDSELTAICMPFVGRATLNDVLTFAFKEGKRPRDAGPILDAIARTSVNGTGLHGQQTTRYSRHASFDDVVLDIALQLADALTFVHGQGIFHRDLKPSNVLLTDQGVPMLLDFNLSQDAGSSRPRIGGTLPYMPPEQLQVLDGDGPLPAGGLDARADLFSLGVMLYEFLVGEHPFGPIPPKASLKEMRELLLANQRRGARPLRQVRADLNPGLCRIVERCLSFDRSHRPSSAAELHGLLSSLTSWPRRIARRVRRNAKPLAACVAFLGLTGVLGAVALAPEGTPSERAYRQGVAAFEQRDYQQAIQHLQRAIEEDPGAARAYFARARAYQELGEWTHAFDNFRKGYELEPDPRAKAGAGYALARKKNYGAAVYFEEAIKFGFGTAVVHNDLGYCYLEQGNLEQALQSLTTALLIDPKLSAAYHNRARIVLKGNVHKLQAPPIQALADVQAAIDFAPRPTAEHHLDAANLCAIASQFDSKWVELGVDHVRQAIALGESSQSITRSALLRRLSVSPHFAEALTARPSQSYLRAARLLDPLAADER